MGCYPGLSNHLLGLARSMNESATPFWLQAVGTLAGLAGVIGYVWWQTPARRGGVQRSARSRCGLGSGIRLAAVCRRVVVACAPRHRSAQPISIGSRLSSSICAGSVGVRARPAQAEGEENMSTSRPNPAASVDAPISSLFHVVRLGWRATDQHR